MSIHSLPVLEDQCKSSGAYKPAIAAYQRVWADPPEADAAQEVNLWPLTALGDNRFWSGDFEPAAEAFRDALNCPRGAGNPFLHLRPDQCEFECGLWYSAAQNLGLAYAVDGADVFAGEAPR